MLEKFQNKYRVPSSRLKGFDYGSHGQYFVTICTKDRKHYFGNIVETHNNASPNINNASLNDGKENASVKDNNASQSVNESNAFLDPTPIAKIALNFWNEIPKHYPFVELDEFVIMPDHIHGILFFNRPEKIDWNESKFGSQSQNLGAVIRGFKASVKRFANQNNIIFDWQPRFHDRIVRDDRELRAIRQYIVNNPKKWIVKTHDNASQPCKDA